MERKEKRKEEESCHGFWRCVAFGADVVHLRGRSDGDVAFLFIPTRFNLLASMIWDKDCIGRWVKVLKKIGKVR